MERAPSTSRWAVHHWRVVAVEVGLEGNVEENVEEGAEVAALTGDGLAPSGASRVELPNDVLRVTHAGLPLRLHRDEAEGYFLNIDAPEPSIFVVWRWNEDETDAIPHMLTLSYNEAARWMDAQEKVERVPMPPPLLAAVSAWVSAHYEPPRKKERIRPKSFESKEGRYKSGM